MKGSASQIYRPDLLEGQVIWITGGGTGIGLQIAQECLALGAQVAIGARKAERLAEAAAALGEVAGAERVWHRAVNIRDTEQVEAWVAAAWDRFGRVDTLVNNAGGQFPSPAEHIQPKGWRAVVDTNLNGTWWMTQAVGQRMIAAGEGGRIVTIVANIWRGFPGMAHTGAARAGVVNLTKSLSLEWARHQIRVNAVAPGIIDGHGLKSYQLDSDAWREELARHVPLRRLGTEQEIAWAVVYLASPAGAWITGETFCLDGGQANWGMIYPVVDG